MFNPYEELIKATQTDSQSQTDGESHTLNEKINDTPVRNSMVSSKNSLMSKFNNLTSHIPVRYNVNSASSKISNKLSSHCQTTARKISRQKCRAQTFHKQLSLLSEYDEESQHDSVFQKQSQFYFHFCSQINQILHYLRHNNDIIQQYFVFMSYDKTVAHNQYLKHYITNSVT